MRNNFILYIIYIYIYIYIILEFLVGTPLNPFTYGKHAK